MKVPVTVSELPSKGRLGGESLKMELTSMTLQDIIEYGMIPAKTYTQRVDRDINMLKKDNVDIDRLFLIDLDCLIFIKKTISISKVEDIKIDHICPHCGKTQTVSFNFKTGLDHCVVPDEALKIKEVVLGSKRFNFQIPTISYYQKVMKEFLKYGEDPDPRISTLCACLGFFDNPRGVKLAIEDATLDEILMLDEMFAWVSGSRKFSSYTCESCGKEADIIVSNMSADMFRAIRLNNRIVENKLICK